MLNGSKAYLSGPMEFSNGDYRTQPAIELLKTFGIQVFDPALDPKEQWVPDIKQAKADKDYMRIKSIAERFFRKDLGMLYQCDMTIAFLPYKVPTVGTHHEIIESWRCMKPTLLVCPDGIENIPVWYFGFMPLEHMFSSWDSLYDYLRRVDSGDAYDDTWYILRQKSD
jgi:hypothetical protein